MTLQYCDHELRKTKWQPDKKRQNNSVCVKCQKQFMSSPAKKKS